MLPVYASNEETVTPLLYDDVTDIKPSTSSDILIDAVNDKSSNIGFLPITTLGLSNIFGSTKTPTVDFALAGIIFFNCGNKD